MIDKFAHKSEFWVKIIKVKELNSGVSALLSKMLQYQKIFASYHIAIFLLCFARVSPRSDQLNLTNFCN